MKVPMKGTITLVWVIAVANADLGGFQTGKEWSEQGKFECVDPEGKLTDWCHGATEASNDACSAFHTYTTCAVEDDCEWKPENISCKDDTACTTEAECVEA